MKVLVAMSLAAFATLAFASERAIYDLQYLPNAGTTYGITNFAVVSGNQRTKTSDSKMKGWSANQQIGHAFTDRFLLSAELDYQHLDSKTEFHYPGIPVPVLDNHDTSRGLSDPRLNGRFRLIDETFRLDFVSTLTIESGKSRSDGHISNIKQGGSSFLLGVEAGQKFDNFQYAGFFNINRAFKSTDHNYSGDFTSDAHNEYNLGGAVLVKLAEKSLLKATLYIEFIDNYDVQNTSQSPAQTTYYSGVEYQHICSANLLLRVGIQASDLNSGGMDYSNIYAATVGANYQF